MNINREQKHYKGLILTGNCHNSRSETQIVTSLIMSLEIFCYMTETMGGGVLG